MLPQLASSPLIVSPLPSTAALPQLASHKLLASHRLPSTVALPQLASRKLLTLAISPLIISPATPALPLLDLPHSLNPAPRLLSPLPARLSLSPSPLLPRCLAPSLVSLSRGLSRPNQRRNSPSPSSPSPMPSPCLGDSPALIGNAARCLPPLSISLALSLSRRVAVSPTLIDDAAWRLPYPPSFIFTQLDWAVILVHSQLLCPLPGGLGC